MTFLLWLLLFLVSWPLALLALLLYPVVWVLQLPFLLLDLDLGDVLELVWAVVTLPMRAWRRMRGRQAASG